MSLPIVKKIDIHAHATPYKALVPVSRFTPHITPEELLAFYDQLDIEKGVLLPLCSPEHHYYPVTSVDMKLLADAHPDRFVWFCNVDPRAARNNPKTDLSEVLNFYKSIGARGMGELTAQLPIDDPLMDNLFYHCGECDMPVTIHIATMKDPYGYYGIRDDLGLPRLEKMLKKHPKLTILGHSQAFWAEMGADADDENRKDFPKGKIVEGRIPKLLREYPNLWCDLSANSGMNALMRDPDYAARFIEEFSDRILYGCDICAPENTQQFEMNDFLNKMREDKMISEENYYKFVRGNALRLLKLEDK